MKARWLDVELGELVLVDFAPLFVGGGIQLGIHLETGVGLRGANQVDDHRVRLQRLPLPVPGHVAEQPVLDLVPLAGPGREMADLDLQPRLVAQSLQLGLPKAIARAVAATAVRGDQQPGRPAVTTAPQALPPTADRGHGELRRVAADAHADPRLVVAQVVDPVGHGLPLARVGEVMGIDVPGLALGPPRPPGILEVPQGLLLLGVHRDRRLPPPLLRPHAAVDVPELGVAVGMGVALAGLAVSLQAVAGLLQQLAHGRRPHRIALGRQLRGQAARALTGPAQRRLRVAAALRFDQPLQGCPDARVHRFRLRPAGPGAALTARRRRITRAQFPDAAADGAVGQSRRGTDDRDTAPPQGHGFDGRPPAPRALGQFIREALELARNPLNNTLIPHEGSLCPPRRSRQSRFRALIYARILTPPGRLPRTRPPLSVAHRARLWAGVAVVSPGTSGSSAP